ncbi:DUF3347 domain-containing protein [Aestuariivivens insulae]|uniref:DUF3347 domain-containing protein n=1 Tax=Aestuariivivens insulae TaxID=1621988 RepID=UPI001F582795|nr:DUF3347 domain-containing protein [Aestuariivivens insulae]
MKRVKLTTSIMLMAFLSLSAMSCKEVKKENGQENAMHSEMDHNEMDQTNPMEHSNIQISGAQSVLKDYMVLKDALVATNKEEAAIAGKQLKVTLKSFDVSGYASEKQEELNGIISDAEKQAELIEKSDIDQQRKHFKTLSKNIMDMIVITGTQTTLYQQFCPMYDGGGAWLSMSKDIKNPYYGSKMLACGMVQKEIN